MLDYRKRQNDERESLLRYLRKHVKYSRLTLSTLEYLFRLSEPLRIALEKAARAGEIQPVAKRKAAAIGMERWLLERFSTRTINGLAARGVLTRAALCKCTASELLRIKNFGTKTMREIILALAEEGLSLAG